MCEVKSDTLPKSLNFLAVPPKKRPIRFQLPTCSRDHLESPFWSCDAPRPTGALHMVTRATSKERAYRFFGTANSFSTSCCNLRVDLSPVSTQLATVIRLLHGSLSSVIVRVSVVLKSIVGGSD